jgi:hypothetical protein
MDGKFENTELNLGITLWGTTEVHYSLFEQFRVL